jgi:hypothetical protein
MDHAHRFTHNVGKVSLTPAAPDGRGFALPEGTHRQKSAIASPEAGSVKCPPTGEPNRWAASMKVFRIT